LLPIPHQGADNASRIVFARRWLSATSGASGLTNGTASIRMKAASRMKKGKGVVLLLDCVR
jgi:hypothetical protein